MWKRAHTNEGMNMDPENFGWILDANNMFQFEWFRGPQLPKTLEDIAVDSETSDSVTDINLIADEAEDEDCDVSDSSGEEEVSDDDEELV